MRYDRPPFGRSSAIVHSVPRSWKVDSRKSRQRNRRSVPATRCALLPFSPRSTLISIFLFAQTLRDELRKLQSGVLLSEKQRNPGVGYFSSFNQSTSTVPTSPDLSSSSSPRATPTASLKSPTESNGEGGVGTGDEALNFEYLRNVILQFLERPEMRASPVYPLSLDNLTLTRIYRAASSHLRPRRDSPLYALRVEEIGS